MDPLSERSKCGQWEIEFDQKFIHFSGRSELSADCFLIPSIIAEKAHQRIQCLCKSGISWMTDNSFELKTFSADTCEHNLLLIFCFFDYAFQDSMSHPLVSFLSIVIHVMETMYSEDGDTTRMSRYQEILSFFLGCVENQVVPDKPTVSVHLLNHLYDTYCHGGPLYALTNFISERLYRFIKRHAFANRYSVETTAKKANIVTVTSNMIMKQNDDTIRCVDGVESTRGIISDLKDISVANLVRDCLFCKSDKLKHETFVDGVYEDSHLSPRDWLSRNYPSISVVVQTNEKVYSRIVVAGESVVAAIHIPSGADDRWVSQHTSNIAFSKL